MPSHQGVVDLAAARNARDDESKLDTLIDDLGRIRQMLDSIHSRLKLECASIWTQLPVQTLSIQIGQLVGELGEIERPLGLSAVSTSQTVDLKVIVDQLTKVIPELHSLGEKFNA